MEKYFPDQYASGRGCYRDYMFNIANTKYPDEVKELIEHAVNQRFKATDEDASQNKIQISDFWINEMKSLPMHSKVRIKLITDILV